MDSSTTTMTSLVHFVYIAAPLSGPPAEYLANVARMSRYARALIDEGRCPINPAADLLEGLMSEKPLTDAQYKERSLDLLGLLAGRHDSAMVVLAQGHRDGSESVGVTSEILLADKLGIPVWYAG